MAQEQKRTTAECRQEVQRRVKAEYEEFLKRYQNLPEKVRFQAMVNDAEKIAFYRDFYIIVVIIEPFYPRDWRWFYEYYLGRPIPALTVLEMSRVESMADTSEYEKIAEQMQIVRNTMSDASIAGIMKTDTPEKLRMRDLFRDGGERLDAWLSVAFVVAMSEDLENGTH